MLESLRIRNLAIVEDLEVGFGSGMNVITGETGAGKSIVLKALELLTGKKAGNDIVRQGAERCEIEGLFMLDGETRSEVTAELEWLEDLLEDGEMIIRRTVDPAGRGKISVNGRMSSRGELEKIARSLVDITAQHAQQRLLEPAEHRRFLDRSGVAPELLQAVSSAYATWAQAARTLEEFRKEKGAKEDYFQRIRFECDEIKKAKLRDGERAELNDELKRLASFETLCATLDEALKVLDDREGGVERAAYKLAALVERAQRLDSGLTSALEMAQSAHAQLSEVKLVLSEYSSKLDANPERLESLCGVSPEQYRRIPADAAAGLPECGE